MTKNFDELVRNAQTMLSKGEGDASILSTVLSACGNSPEVLGPRLEAALNAYDEAEAKAAEEKANAESEAEAAEEKAKASKKEMTTALRTVLEDHFDHLVKELQEASSLLSRLGKENVSDAALLSDAIKHLNASSVQLYFVRRDSDEDVSNLEDLVNEAFRQATEQLIELRESRPADSLRVINTLVNVSLRMSTERLVDIRTLKD